MDWTNERYVRAYVRDTADYLVLSWQARGLWWEVLRKADRSGVIATNHGAKGVAALVRWPIEVVEAALPELLMDGCVRPFQGGFVIPNYLDAQEAVASTAQRQRESRERRRLHAVTISDDSVTFGDENVTRGHAESRSVTPSRAVPSQAVPNQERDMSAGADCSRSSNSKSNGRRRAKPSEPTPDEQASALRILSKLSERSGVQYRGSANHIALITKHLREGVSELELRAVVAYCADELGWQDKPNMREYLRPKTLFGPEKIHDYLDAARTHYAKQLNGASHQEPS